MQFVSMKYAANTNTACGSHMVTFKQVNVKKIVNLMSCVVWSCLLSHISSCKFIINVTHGEHFTHMWLECRWLKGHMVLRPEREDTVLEVSAGERTERMTARTFHTCVHGHARNCVVPPRHVGMSSRREECFDTSSVESSPLAARLAPPAFQ